MKKIKTSTSVKFSFPDLPSEIIIHSLALLPVQDLAIFRTVSSSWRAYIGPLISSPSIAIFTINTIPKTPIYWLHQFVLDNSTYDVLPTIRIQSQLLFLLLFLLILQYHGLIQSAMGYFYWAYMVIVKRVYICGIPSSENFLFFHLVQLLLPFYLFIML